MSEDGAPPAPRRPRDGHAIAIVGMACLFPGAPGLREFWENVLRAEDAVRDVPAERWDPELFFAPDRRAPDRTYGKRGAFLGDHRFDPLQYGIPPATVEHIEPAQLLTLEMARLALADAGYDARPFARERTSVIVACSGIHDVGIGYAVRSMLPHFLARAPELDAAARERIVRSVRDTLPAWSEDAFPGFLPNVIAGRIANRLDLGGANFVVDAACSSALAAVQTAVSQLRDGTCDVALAAAVDGSNNAFTFMSFAKAQALTPGAVPRPFDDAADGIVLGEGVAAVVLKRLADAERDGDRVYAVIRGVGCSSDGRNRSLTAPFVEGQVRAMHRAYEDADVDPATVELVEAHATGTAVGDAVEIAGLGRVFSGARCAIGSVKSMIGHAKAAAGLAGLVKAALAVQQGVLPPTLNVDRPNAALGAGETLYVNDRTRPWVRADAGVPRRAGVSAFGFGGTNFHVVLEAPATDRDDLAPRPCEVFAWRGATREDLEQVLRGLRSGVAAAPTVRLDRLAAAVHAADTGAVTTSGVRLALVATTADDLGRKLDRVLTALQAGDAPDAPGVFFGEGEPADPGCVAFLYPGQGAQRVGMLADLVHSGPFGAAAFEQADELLADLLPRPLSDHIFPRPVFTGDERARQRQELADTRIAQPAIGAVNLFATDVLARFGIRPAYAAGHSYGEYVALCAAGVYSRRDLLRLSARRGQAVHECASAGAGGMAAVAADADTTRAALDELGLEVYVANLNAPRQTIVAARSGVLDEALAGLAEKGLAVRRVAVTAAFHSPLVASASESLRGQLARLDMQAPRIPVYSNVTAEPHANDPAGVRDLLMRHLESPVRFVDEIRAMHRDGARVFLEVGPGRILTGLTRRILAGEPHVALAIDEPGQPGWQPLGYLLARAVALGLPVDLSPWFAGRGLATSTPDDVLAAAAARALGRPTDWWVQPAGSRPAGDAALAARDAARELHATESTPEGVPDQVGAPPADELALLRREHERLADRLAALEAGRERPGLSSLSNPASPAKRAPTAAEPNAAVRPTLPVAPAPVLPALHPTGPPPERAPSGDAAPTLASGTIPTLDEFRRDLLTEVTRRTGYPEEMLEPDLPLEAGLGIDSIKVMEIFSALRRYHGILADEDLPEEEVITRFAELRTLQAIYDHYAAQRVKLLAAGSPVPAAASALPAADVTPAPPARPATPAAAGGNGAEIERLVVRSVPARLHDEDVVGRPLRFPADRSVLILGDGAELGGAILTVLRSGGHAAFLVVHGNAARRRPDGIYEADLDAASGVAKLRALLSERGVPPVGGIVNLSNLADEFRRRGLDATDAPLRLARRLLHVAQTFEGDVRAAVPAGGGIVLNVTTLDGRFGLSGRLPLPVAQAASVGFFKSLSREWPNVRVKNLDIDPALGPSALLAGLAAEIASEDEALEVGLDTEGRWGVELVADAAGPGGVPVSSAAEAVDALAVPLDAGSVVLATGGAHGITAEVLKLLATETAARLVVVGRTARTTAADEPEHVRGVLEESALRAALIESAGAHGGATPADVERALRRMQRSRRVRENLAQLEAAATSLEYHALDVRDEPALVALVRDVRSRLGRIDGVIHGAGVIEDRRLRDKTAESFERVFDTKVRPAMVLARELRDAEPRFLAFFSSLSGRFGNAGQIDYSAANESLNKLAAHLDREWPGRVVALNWGPWDAGMLSDGLKAAYARRGIRLIAVRDGSRAFLDELRRGATGSPEVVLACDARRLAEALDR